MDWADTVVAHNIKHDMTILRYYGISFEKVKLWCTMVAEYILSGQDTRQRTFGLSAVAKHYGFPPKLDKVKALWDAGVNTYDINSDLLHEYVLDDCQKTLDIYRRQVVEVARQKMQKIVDLQMEWTLSLSDMELGGFKFDVEAAQKIVDEYEYEMDKLLNEIRGFAVMNYDSEDELLEEFNPGSPKQVSAYLFGGTLKMDGKIWTSRELKKETKYYQKKGKVEVTMPGLGFEPPTKKRNDDGSVPTDKTIISKLRGNTPDQKIVLSALTQYSKFKKAKETLKGKTEKKGLINKVRSDGHIHPNFNQCVATTGRLTSSDPNGQNLPRGSTSPIKTCIVSSFLDGCILQIDLSQIEWRAAAWLSQDKTMMYEVNSGIDQHNEACVHLMELPLNKENRNYAKIFNFRMIYGGVAYGYYMDQKMPNFSLKKWQQIVNDFYEKYHGLAEWQYERYTDVMMYGEMIIPTGRKFVFIKDEKGEYPERNVKNYPVQGIAGADILPLLGVMIRRGLKHRKLKSHYSLTVHDSLVLDVDSSERSTVIDLISKCVASLSQSVSRYYNIDWNVRLEGEIEYGNNYGKLGHTIKV
jgi:DNA polymerase-1